MRQTGWFLIAAGLLLAVIGLMSDTTVEGSSADALSGAFSRVYNMGLMARRQLLMDLAQHLTLVGALLLGIGSLIEQLRDARSAVEQRLVDVRNDLGEAARALKELAPSRAAASPDLEGEEALIAARLGITKQGDRYVWQGNHFKQLASAIHFAQRDKPVQ